jgi:uncharacterized protein
LKKSIALIVLFICLFLTLIAVHFASHLKFSYDFEEFFPKEDEDFETYMEFRKKFEHDNEFVLIALENQPGIFHHDFLMRTDSLTGKLKQIPDIIDVVSPTNLKKLILGGLMPVKVPVLNFTDKNQYSYDSVSIYNNENYIGSFFSKKGNAVCIYIKTEEGISKKRSDSLAQRIDRTVNSFRFDKSHIVGRIVAQQVYLSKLQSEFFLFLGISFLLVVLFLAITFRSISGVVLPVSIVLLGILWTLGLMGFWGKTIDIMTVMLPTMVFIAGMSDIVHFFSKYFEEIQVESDPKVVYKNVIREVAWPTFLTLLSTVAGFLSLLFSSIKPIRDFGIFTSVGICIAFILTYSLLPALLTFFKPKKLIQLHHSNNKFYSNMRLSLFWILRNQKSIAIGSCFVVIISLWGISQIRTNNILLEDLDDSVRVKQDFLFFDKEFSGVRPVEIFITTQKSHKAWDYPVMREIDELHNYLKTEYGAGFLVSPALITRELNQSLFEQSIQSPSFPDESDYSDIKKYITSNKNNKELKRLMTSDGKFARITGKMPDVGSLVMKEKNEKLTGFIEKNIDKNLVDIKVTGTGTLLDKNNDFMVNNMLQGFLFSVLIIGGLTWFLHRSLKMVVVFIIPNLFPLVIVGGIMGFFGIELKAATSLVFSIAFGIATDDTIHFISRFKIERDYGKSVLYAFKRTYFETGRPILVTSFILIGGFMSLMISDFQSVFYFGLLICLTLVIAVAADMLLLPVLLLWMMKKEKSIQKSE